MFANELKTFKQKVVSEMWTFFKKTPEQVDERIASMQEEYGKFCDLDRDTFNTSLSSEYKSILMEYKTMCYFSGIFHKLIEIETFFNEVF